MKRLTKTELKEALEGHKQWLSWLGGNRADLSRTDLRRTDLRRAYLRGADLRRAYLRGAYLSWADLRRADLRGADFSGAYLSGAYLSGADLRRADLSRTEFSGADFSGAYLSGAKGLPEAPSIKNIDAEILKRIEAGENLEMCDWHTCETTHCRAGWAVVLAGDRGLELERQFGPNVAGALIYNASRPGQRVPDFYSSNEKAMADIKACAASQAADS